jgi:hypothetical protein
MKRQIFILISVVFTLCILATSCNSVNKAQRTLQKIEKDYPQLFTADTTIITRIDTIKVVTNQIEHDTILSDSDTIHFETERIKMKIIRVPFESVQVKTIIKSDTLNLIQHDTIKVVQKEIVTKTDIKTVVPFWLYIVIVLLILYLLYIMFFRRI